MKIYLKSLKHYFLTVDTNGSRKKHMIEEFKDYDLTEVSPIKGIGKSKSGATGFSKMLDIALREQERTKPFAPFIMYEDDCSKYREYPEYIDIPDDADVCYIGLSICSMNETSWHHGMYYRHIDSDVVQIYNMLALHGIMICSASGALAIQKAVLEGYYKNMPWDIFTAQIQSYYKFYALKEPLVFQDIAYGGAQSATKIKINSHGNDVPLPDKFINTTNDSIIMTCCCENATKDSTTINLDRTLEQKVIFVLWLGDEQINETRQQAINNMPKWTILITKDNISNYILPDYPLHPAYNYLSTIHKSDYLRCYLMHHYGGGYSDVKSTNFAWDKAFEKMNQHSDIMIMGVKTTYGHTYAGIEEWSPSTRDEIISNIDKFLCMGWFICRRNTQLTSEWYNELNKRLDFYLPKLQLNPAKFTRECFHPHLGCALDRPDWEGGGVQNGKSQYPISWNVLLSQILYPIQLKYMKNIDNTLNSI